MAFLEHFEGVCTEEYCGIMLKKPDKKKERLDIRESVFESIHPNYV